MSEEGKVIFHTHEKNQEPANEADYGTFEGVPQSSQPHAYQSVPGYAVPGGLPVRDHHDHHRLPCCGIGYGWFFFIIGFFLAGIPWYAAAIILICCRNVDPREKPGYICCAVFSILGIIVTVLGVIKQTSE